MYLKDLIICLNFRYFDYTYADIILRLTVQPRWHFKIFILQKILWKVHHPKEEQVVVIMHEGISKSRVSASLLQGNTMPKTRSLFFQRRSSLNRLPVQAWSPAWPDGCTVRQSMMSAYVKSKYLKCKHMIKYLRYMIPAIIGHEVGLANLETEVS